MAHDTAADKLNVDFELPEDVHSLAVMRDELADYLATMERNTDAVNNWLTQNKDKIIVGNHKLQRAISIEKNDAMALNTLKSLGDAAGFVLALDDFAAMAQTHLGAQSAFLKEISGIQLGIPQEISEKLPEITGGKKQPEPVQTPSQETTEEKKSWWSSLFASEKEDPEAAVRELAEMRRRWQEIRSDLIALQSTRHYYVDSFMEWVGETLAPESDTSARDSLMQQYQDPRYVISLAQQDYDAATRLKTIALKSEATDYAARAATLDRQDIDAFAASLPALFPDEETEEALHSKKLLLQDFDSASFAEVALTQVKNPADRYKLLKAAVALEENITMSGGVTTENIFYKILDQCTAYEKPLDAAALTLMLKTPAAKNARLAHSIVENRLFARISNQYDGNAERRAELCSALLEGMESAYPQMAYTVCDIVEAARKKDATTVEKQISAVAHSDQAAAFITLFTLSYPEKSFLSLLEQAAEGATTAKPMAALLEAASSAGLLGDLARTDAPSASNVALSAVFEKHVLPYLADFPIDTAKAVLHIAHEHGGLHVLRQDLEKENGWLESIVKTDMEDERKLEWVSLLLAPFGNDVIRANILSAAAGNALNNDSWLPLHQMEKNLVGNNIRINDETVISNIHQIANIWYNHDDKRLLYTVGGTSNCIQENISSDMAGEIFKLLRRRTPMEQESTGLFNPAHIDKFIGSDSAMRVYWNWSSGDLHPDNDARAHIESRHDFLHETDTAKGVSYHTNAQSIALLQPLEDGGYLMIDKYGTPEQVNDNVVLPSLGGLIDIGHGAFINPSCVSILSIGDDNIEIRIESKDFDAFMEQSDPDESFYKVPATADGIARLETSIASDARIATPGGNLQNLYFNFSALGYLNRQETSETGFSCKRYSNIRKPGLIHTDDDLTASICEGLSKHPDIVSIGSVYTHASLIDDAYYNAAEKNLYLIFGTDALEVPCKEAEAYKLIRTLEGMEGFKAVGFTNIQGKAQAADVINAQRATLYRHAPHEGRTSVYTDHEGFPINQDSRAADSLFDELVREGMQESKSATTLPWVRDIGQHVAWANASNMRQSFNASAKPDAAALWKKPQASAPGKDQKKKHKPAF